MTQSLGLWRNWFSTEFFLVQLARNTLGGSVWGSRVMKGVDVILSTRPQEKKVAETLDWPTAWSVSRSSCVRKIWMWVLTWGLSDVSLVWFTVFVMASWAGITSDSWGIKRADKRGGKQSWISSALLFCLSLCHRNFSCYNMRCEEFSWKKNKLRNKPYEKASTLRHAWPRV